MDDAAVIFPNQIRLLTRILLIRHGPSAHSRNAGWLDAAGFQRWRDEADAIGIAAGHQPPPSLLALVAAADAVVSSDLPRAVESAQRLAPAQPFLQSPVLRESRLHLPASIPLRLPVAAWDGLTHFHWGFDILRGTDVTPREQQRADQALAWLHQLDGGPATIAVITHGVFRRLLAQRLAAQGWRAAERRRSYKCWSVWSFQKE